MQRTIHLSLAFFAVMALMLSTPRQADAELQHRYSFTSNINDSVGGAHGTLVDPNGIGFFTGGRLDLTAIADGMNSNQAVFSTGAYVDLPNGIVSGLGNTGTFEIWTNVAQNRTWAEIFSLGSSNEGENISTGGPGSHYITLIPQAGANRLEVHITEVGVDNGCCNPIRPEVAPLAPGVEHHLVVVVDGSDTQGGANPDGTGYLYLNGALMDSSPLYPGFALSSLPDVNNWLGRSQWPDALFDGTYNEFRMYDHALGGGDVALNTILGPDVLAPEEGVLSLEVNTVTGQVKLVNNVSVEIPFNYYEVKSAGGALSTSGWDSFDDQENDAPGEGWDESGGVSANQLIELFLAEAGDTIAANGELTLGDAFNESVFGSGNDGDLTFQFGLTGASGLLSGSVSYVTTAGVPGDYNSNGTVDAADYTVWRDNLGSGTALANDDTPGVGQDDYTRWKNNFGNSAGSGSVAAGAVPEPTTVVYLLGVVVGVAYGARRRAR